MKPAFFRALCGVLLLLCAPALAQGGTLVGAVVNGADKKPLADVRVTATSPVLKAEQVAVTDSQGNYRITQLPPGVYSLRFEKESFRPLTRADLQLTSSGTVLVNAELLHVASVPASEVAASLPSSFQPLAPLAPPLRAEADGVARYLPSAMSFIGAEGGRALAPVWTLPHMSVLPDGATQYLYRNVNGASGSRPHGAGSSGVNPTIDTEEDRFSAFFVSVDTAPYATARDYLERDVLPDERTVWAEAFINAFDYGDAGDTHGPFVIDVEGFPSPSRKGYHVVRITLKAREALSDVSAQVEFDRQAVARYRLVGYERASPAPESLDEEDEPDAPMRAGGAVTAIYEVKVIGPALAFGTLRIHYEQGPSGSWRRVQKMLPSSLLRSSYARAAPATRLAYVAAAFAEKLRGSFWTRSLDWARLHALWDDVGEPLRGRADVVTLGTLIRKAQALDRRKDRYERIAPGTAMDLDNVPDSAD